MFLTPALFPNSFESLPYCVHQCLPCCLYQMVFFVLCFNPYFRDLKQCSTQLIISDFVKPSLFLVCMTACYIYSSMHPAECFQFFGTSFSGSEGILWEFTTWPSSVSSIPNMLIPSSISRIWLFHYFPSYYCYSSSFCHSLSLTQTSDTFC